MKDLTRCFTEKHTKPPNCIAKWDHLVPGIDWRTLLARYTTGLITPKDFGSHYKLIFHRAFLTNPHNPRATTHLCRACGAERETILHLGKCPTLKPVFEFMRKFDRGSTWEDVKLNLFGVNEMKGTVPRGTSALHFILWKFVLIQLTMLSLKNEPLRIEDIITQACKRLAKRVKAQEYEMRCEECKAQSRDSQMSYSKFVTRLEGIATVADGKIVLHDDIQAILDTS